MLKEKKCIDFPGWMVPGHGTTLRLHVGRNVFKRMVMWQDQRGSRLYLNLIGKDKDSLKTALISPKGQTLVTQSLDTGHHFSNKQALVGAHSAVSQSRLGSFSPCHGAPGPSLQLLGENSGTRGQSCDPQSVLQRESEHHCVRGLCSCSQPTGGAVGLQGGH